MSVVYVYSMKIFNDPSSQRYLFRAMLNPKSIFTFISIIITRNHFGTAEHILDTDIVVMRTEDLKGWYCAQPGTVMPEEYMHSDREPYVELDPDGTM